MNPDEKDIEKIVQRSIYVALRPWRLKRNEVRFEALLTNIFTQTGKLQRHYFVNFNGPFGHREQHGEMTSKIKRLERHVKANPNDFVTKGVYWFLKTEFTALFGPEVKESEEKTEAA